MDKRFLITYLPPDQGNDETIVEDQTVPDIINEVVDSHIEFSYHYDSIAHFFEKSCHMKIAKALFDFCKSNIKYNIESVEDQTTRSPAVLLKMGEGDCKHYSGFIGGVFSALNRKGYKIDYWYRFASYKLLDSDPGHVFVVMDYKGNEIWIDPVLDSFNERLDPTYIVDIKIDDMALRRLSGFDDMVVNGIDDQVVNGIKRPGFGMVTVGAVITPVINIDQLNFDGTHKYAGAFGPNYLGLSGYADFTSGSGTDWNQLADQLNKLISEGPQPGFAVPPDFVKWVFDESIRSWNFFYPGGVAPGFNAANLLPAGYPRPVLTNDGRLTLSHDALLDDYRNGEIHLITAWLQSIINDQDTTPYPIKPRSVKLFSQSYTGNPNNPEANFFNEWRGKGIFEEIGKALESYLNFVKDGVLLLVNSIPRNALLLLLRWNYNDMATDAWNKMQSDASVWPKSAKKWERAGGNPAKLYDAIKDGNNKAAVSGPVPILEEETKTQEDKEDFLKNLPGLLAAAAALIKLLFSLFDKNKTAQAIASRVPFGEDTDIITTDDNDENKGGGNDDLPGKTPEWLIPALAVGTILLLSGKKSSQTKVSGISKNNLLTMLLIGVGIKMITKKPTTPTPPPTLPAP